MSGGKDTTARSGILTGSFVPAPLVLVIVAAGVALTGLAMTFVGAAQTGLSADEYGHVRRLQGFYDDGLFVRNWERWTPPGTVPPNAYVYAPGTARVMHLANVVVGNEGSGEVATTAQAFTVRHYVIAAMGVAGTLATVGLAWLVLGGWRWAVVAAGALAAVPMWTGHAMFNPKDTPVGVGNVLMTFGLGALVLAATKSGLRRLALVAGSCLVLIFGLTLMLGTRPGMWPAVVSAVVAVVAILAIGRQLDRWVLAGLSVSLAASYAALWKLYPKVFGDPGAYLTASLGQSTSFPHGIAPGRGYIFERMAIEWPVLLLLLSLLGTVVAAIVCFRMMRAEPRKAVLFGLVGVQAYALIVAAVLTKANVYDGLRQLLFTVPAQAVLVAIGAAVVVGLMRGRASTWTLTGALVAALVLPMIVQARLHPYQYAYGNVVAEWADADILNDNWKVSFREYVEDVPPTVRAACPNDPPPTGPINGANYSDCRGSFKAFAPFWQAYWHHARYDPDSPKFYTLLRAQRPVPTNCRVVDEVTRMRNLEQAVMSTLLLCTQDGVK